MPDNEKLVQDLIAKALKDPAFKAELVRNPAAAIEKASGVKVPAGVTVKIVEDTASVVHLVLPGPSPKAKGAELSESQLAGAVGGAGAPGLPPSFLCRNSSSPCL